MLHGHVGVRDPQGGTVTGYDFQSLFAGRIIGMLELSVELGYSPVSYRADLGNFDRFCMNNFPSEASPAKSLSIAWCSESTNGRHRAMAIRAFGRYLSSIGEDAFIVPCSLFPGKKPDLPRLFAESEIRNFLDAADSFPAGAGSPLLEYTVPVIFRLQYACGLRPREVRLLKRADFNQKECTVYVADSKGHKDRRLAVSTDVMDLCMKYDHIADILYPGRLWFFQSPSGGAYRSNWLSSTFRRCWELSGNAGTGGTPCTFRHMHATRTLMGWAGEGRDLDAMIPYLAAYMGRESFSSTYYYMHLLPERLRQMDFTKTNDIIPEVSHEKESERQVRSPAPRILHRSSPYLEKLQPPHHGRLLAGVEHAAAICMPANRQGA